MCGGDGTRLESAHEKPLHPIDGVPMVERVLAALESSHIETNYAAVSPNAPKTRTHLESIASDEASVHLLETPGNGYVSDLVALLERDEIDRPVLTVAADLPLLEAATIDRVLESHERGPRECSLTICVPVALKRRLGVSVETRLEEAPHLAPTGLNVVGAGELTEHMRSYNPRLAVNVNRREDSHRAAQLL
ncbi:NTP transferase domain-containing protein [Natronolimnobius sp. AArcel1]|uniref:NTP transferase domain-containing protein n=1 Tax=Natronolimnobius sp. AArcel1 TaxID=1679093 RepID=UPI0013EAF1B1|nr:NTP transferase domain-containing protein [Natronolimnobius sp. AArcel1]NGM67889.1 NTP transferase domain-containing protein [Natronolimnobius sp. AArcel1]